MRLREVQGIVFAFGLWFAMLSPEAWTLTIVVIWWVIVWRMLRVRPLEQQVGALMRGLPDLREVELKAQRKRDEEDPLLRTYRRISEGENVWQAPEPASEGASR